MRTIFWLSLICLCLVVLPGNLPHFNILSKVQPKQIGWKATAEKIRQLEQLKKETFDAIKAKSQKREISANLQSRKEAAQGTK